MKKYKIVIVDDHQMFLNGLEAILKNNEKTEIVGSYNNPHNMISNLKKDHPDLIITDISMPEMSGIDLIKKAREILPSIKTLILSMHTEINMVKTAIKENPDGYLLKNTNQEELFEAIQNIKNGKKHYSPSIQTILIDSIQGNKESSYNIIPTLSPREKQVLELIAKEHTTQEIADLLFLSTNTVETYRQNLLQKFNAKNAAGIVAKAYQFNLL